MLDPTALIKGISPYLGLPYDYRYAPDKDEIYCSELVYLVYRDTFKIEIDNWQQLGDLNWKNSEPFIRNMEGGPLPLERKMVTPVSLTQHKNVRRVFPPKREK